MKERILRKIQATFRTFGQDGRKTFDNPVAAALKDMPLQFAGGVDVGDVIDIILKESGHDKLLKACKAAFEELNEQRDRSVHSSLWAGELADELKIAIAEAEERK